MMEIDKAIRDDPKYFFEKYLGCSPWEKQWEILYSIRDNRKTTVRSCHGSGKTWLISRAALWFMYAFPPAIVIDTAPTARQVKNQFWREFRSAHARALRPLGGELLKTQFDIDEDWFALGFSTKETEQENVADKFQGFHGKNIFFIVDEASGVSNGIFEAIDGALSGGMTVRLVYIGNPTKRTGYFADSFKDPNFKKFRISAFDIPNIKEKQIIIPGLANYEWVDDIRQKYGEDSDVWRVRVMGEFPLAESDTLIAVDSVEDSIDRDVDRIGEQEIIGLDVARFGGDKTIFTLRKGNYSEILAKIYKRDATEVVGIAVKFLDKFKDCILNIDTVGYGAGIYDMLREKEKYRSRVFAVNVGEKPKDTEQFKNLRAELFFAVKDWLKTAVLKKDEEWYQLANIKYKYSSLGQLQIESKEDMKKRGLSSPDVADSLMLTFANTRKPASLADVIKSQQTKPITSGITSKNF